MTRTKTRSDAIHEACSLFWVGDVQGTESRHDRCVVAIEKRRHEERREEQHHKAVRTSAIPAAVRAKLIRSSELQKGAAWQIGLFRLQIHLLL